MSITGKTRLYFTLAHPIEHVRAPELFNPLFAARGIDAVMVPVHVAPEDFPAAWEGFRKMRNLGGMAVSNPYKMAVLELSDEAGPAARQVGAANVVRREPDGRMVCDNFDGAGFLAGLRKEGVEPTGKRALLVGAGGAGMAIAFALAGADLASLTIANRTGAKAEELARAVGSAHPGFRVSAGPADPSGHDLVVNATSLGLRPEDPLPLETAWLTPDMTVADIIMKPAETRLLREAKAIGCRLHPGRHMLDQQLPLLACFMRVEG